MNERDYMLEVAEKVAQLLLTVPEVSQVALFGSVARGEEDPSDIDLFVLTNDQFIPEMILEDAYQTCRWLYPFGYTDALVALDAMHLLDDLDEVAPDVDLNIIVMPIEPTHNYLWEFETLNYDPCFLENAAKDFQLFDSVSCKFQSAEAPWSNYLKEDMLRIVEGFFHDDYKAGFAFGYNVVVDPHEFPDEDEWFHFYCLNDEVAEQVMAIVPSSHLVTPTKDGNPVVLYSRGDLPEALLPEAKLSDLEERLEEEGEWDEDEYYEDYHCDPKKKCPECGETVERDDEACANCDAQLLPIPPDGFGSDGRPHWGSRQVRTPRGIKPGNILTMVWTRSQVQTPIVVLSEPYPDAACYGWLRFDYLEPKSILPTSRRFAFLSDFGVTRHGGGRGNWSRINHLERTGRKRVDISTLNISD